MNKRLLITMIALLSLNLAACNNKTAESEPKAAVKSQQIVAKHTDIRLKFNDIVLAKADQEFKGGTNLAKLKELFGEPIKHEQTPAGDVTLDAYRWQFDQVEVNVQLFEDSAITRSISYFSFIKDPTITLKTFEQLTTEMSYKQAVDLLGEPDALSEAISSDKEELQAIWTSGLKTDNANQGQVQLFFENGKLKTLNQIGLTN